MVGEFLSLSEALRHTELVRPSCIRWSSERPPLIAHQVLHNDLNFVHLDLDDDHVDAQPGNGHLELCSVFKSLHFFFNSFLS